MLYDTRINKNNEPEYHKRFPELDSIGPIILKCGHVTQYLCEVTKLLHNEDGPAMIFPLGYRWFLQGKDVTDKVNELMEKGKLNPIWEQWTTKDKAIFKLYTMD